MELRHLQSHIATCEYQLVSCDLMCGEKVMLWSLPAHRQDTCARRHVSCPLCADEMLAQDVQSHESVCREIQITCEWCHGDLFRKHLKEHLSLCLELPAHCSFALHGCSEKMERQKLKEHHKLEMYRHVEMLNTAVMAIHDGMGLGGGGDRLGVRDQVIADAPIHRPYELPTSLWHTVTAESEATVAWSELPGAVYGPMKDPETPKGSLHDRVVQLERLDMRLIRRIADTVQKYDNRISETEEMCNNKIAEVEEMCDNKIVEIANHHKKEMAELSAKHVAAETENKRLSNAMELLIKQNKITQNNIHNMFMLSNVSISMKKTDILQDDMHYKLPIYWTVTLDKHQGVTSPSFYTETGYKMSLKGFYYGGGSNFYIFVHVLLGSSDETLIWPWDEELELVVREKETGQLAQHGGTHALTRVENRKRPMNDTDQACPIGATLKKDVPHNTTVVVELHRIECDTDA